MTRPRPPAGLGQRGARFWRDVQRDYSLDRAELEVLAECCRILDLIDSLRAEVAETGVIVAGSMGQPRVHPAVPQLLAAQALLGRLLRSLALPALPSEEERALEAWEAFTAWRAARRAYAKLHPRSLLGDVVTRRRVELATRRRMHRGTS